MAEIKTTMTVSLEEFGKKAGEYALDEYEYNGLTIRQWADKITSGEYQPAAAAPIVRCKDCAFIDTLECRLNYIDKQRMIITERSPMFFCGKAQATAGYEPTNGDNIRNMSDAQLADLLYSKEKEGYDMHGHEGKAFSWALLKKIYRAYVSTPEGEDIEVKE